MNKANIALLALATAALAASVARADDAGIKNPPQVTVGGGYVVNSQVGTVNGADQTAKTSQGGVGTISYHDDKWPFMNSVSGSLGYVGNTLVGSAEVMQTPNPRNPYDTQVIGLSGRNTNQYLGADFIYGGQETFGAWDRTGVTSTLFFHVLPASILMSHPGGQPDQTFYAPGLHAGGQMDFGPYVSAYLNFGLRVLVPMTDSSQPGNASGVGSMLSGEAGLASNFWLAGQKFQVAASATAEEADFKRVDAPNDSNGNPQMTGFRDLQGNLLVRTAF